MGSQVSSCMYIPPCASTPDITAAAPSTSAIKVVHALEHRIIEIQESIKAAELMLEFPNHFVVEIWQYYCSYYRPATPAQHAADSGHKKIMNRGAGQCGDPLPADEDLRPCHAYLLVPMQAAVHKRLSRHDMEAFARLLLQSPSPASASSSLMSLSSSSSSPSSNLPASSSPSPYSHSQKGEAKPSFPQLQVQASMAHHYRQVTRCRSWMPKLETIDETSLLKSYSCLG